MLGSFFFFFFLITIFPQHFSAGRGEGWAGGVPGLEASPHTFLSFIFSPAEVAFLGLSLTLFSLGNQVTACFSFSVTLNSSTWENHDKPGFLAEKLFLLPPFVGILIACWTCTWKPLRSTTRRCLESRISKSARGVRAQQLFLNSYARLLY